MDRTIAVRMLYCHVYKYCRKPPYHFLWRITSQKVGKWQENCCGAVLTTSAPCVALSSANLCSELGIFQTMWVTLACDLNMMGKYRIPVFLKIRFVSGVPLMCPFPDVPVICVCWGFSLAIWSLLPTSWDWYVPLLRARVSACAKTLAFQHEWRACTLTF